MSIPLLSPKKIGKSLIKITKNTVMGSIPDLKNNPINAFLGLKNFDMGVLSSLLPASQGMMGFLCPELALAGVIMKGAKGFAEGMGEMKRVMPSVPRGPQAGEAKGRDLDTRIDSIMNSDIPVGEKITLLAAVMADSLDKQAEDVMKDWSSDMKRVARQGKPGDKKATKSNKESNSQYLQVRLQQLMEKKNQLISLASNMNKAEHTTKSSVIRNIRV